MRHFHIHVCRVQYSHNVILLPDGNGIRKIQMLGKKFRGSTDHKHEKNVHPALQPGKENNK